MIRVKELSKIILLFVLSLGGVNKIISQERPNIVLIMADDLGYGGISCYGNKTINTPNLDALAANGVKFTDFHSNGSVCSPTRAALMTGKYQQRTGVGGVITAKKHREVGLSLDEVTLADALSKLGYNNGMFGKWHLGYSKGYNPILQGFDEFTGFVSGNIDYHGHIDQEGYLDWWKGDVIYNEKGYSTDLITHYGIKFIEKNNPEKTGKPFFLYLPHEAPHGPYQRRVDKTLRKVGKAKTAHVKSEDITSIYKEMVEVMDEGIGRIIESLKETKQYENTIVIFISDNGANKYGDNGGLRGYKADVYEGGSRVPALFSYPGKIKNGVVSNELALSMDVFPTVLRFAGSKPTTKLDGVSLKSCLLRGHKLPTRDVFYAFENKSFIRSDHWKLINLENENKVELYNLFNDLGEQHDLSQKNTRLVKKLKKKLDKWKQEVSKGVEKVSG